MSSDSNDLLNISVETGTYSIPTELVAGDDVELIYEDAPQTILRAKVNRILTDRDESLGPEVENYVACWLEIEVTSVEGEDLLPLAPTNAWTCAMALCTDFTYTLDGRRVRVRKS
jgi:hypothetical protein